MSYVNKPGGVIAHLDDGRSVALAYGEAVPDNLASYVDAGEFSDSKQRLASDPAIEQVRESHARTALAEGGQVNSGSSPVPANYNELDEDTKVRLVADLARYPELQAKILIHESLFGGDSERVFDAAGEGAQISSKLQLAAEVNGLADFSDKLEKSPGGLGDPNINAGDDATTERIAQRAAQIMRSAQDGTPPPTGVANVSQGPGDALANMDSNQLRALAETEGVSVGNTTDPAKLVAKIEAARADQ